jgi:hypothetical protein
MTLAQPRVGKVTAEAGPRATIARFEADLGRVRAGDD